MEKSVLRFLKVEEPAASNVGTLAQPVMQLLSESQRSEDPALPK
jgi:hypothetical protein